MKWYSSIKIQLSILIVFLITTILAVFGTYNYMVAKDIMQEELEEFANVATNRLSKHLVLPLWSLNQKQAAESVEAEMGEKMIHAIIVREGDGNSFLLGRTKNSNGQITEAVREPIGDFIKKEASLTYDSKTLGSVEVYVTPKIMQDKIRKTMISIIVEIVVLDIAIFLTIFLLISTKVIKNVKHLTIAAEKMSMGDLKTKIGIKSKNEIGLLAQAIERMQDSLGIALSRMKTK